MCSVDGIGEKTSERNEHEGKKQVVLISLLYEAKQ